MTARRSGKKLLKVTGYISVGLAILLIAFHIWFIQHAKHMLEDIVKKKSNGKLNLKIEKLSYDYLTNRMNIKEAVFFTTDSVSAPASYRFGVKEIDLQIKVLWPLIFQKKLLINSLLLQSPDIRVTNLRYPPGDSVKKNKKDISIPEEMGKVYNSIQDALKVLQVNRFQIDDGKFTLINKIQPDQLPLIVNNINFHIDNLEVDTSKLTGKEKLFFSDNVVLKSDQQDIIFPDGRHRLSFDRFRINIRKKIVEFDSCTISAIKTDSTKTSFSVFFDKLLLSNIDFDTLYKNEVIKADTVFCLNPQFKLQTGIINKKDGPNGTGSQKIAVKSPKLDDIIQQLTGDLLLKYVIVNNASFDITTIKNGHPNSFTSHGNNFEMQGLSIDHDAEKLVTVKSFAMAIRNYENFIKDSIYRVQFDSIVFKDNHISLSNFIFNKLDNDRIINTFNIPHFYLEGLSWDELVFEKRLKADHAIMLNPYISYTVSKKQKVKKRRQNLFQSLAAVNEYMDLQRLDVVEGTIDLKIKSNLRGKLENATFSIQSHALFTSTKLAEIKRSLTNLDFDNGIIQAGNLRMELHNIHYFGQGGKFDAGSIHINNKEKNMSIDLQDANIEKMLVNEVSGNIYAEGVRWQKGDVKINIGEGKKNAGGSSVELKNVQGSNTSISGMFGDKSVSTKINSISFTGMEIKPGSKLKLDELDINGQQLKVKDDKLDLSIADYAIRDNKNSSFRQIVYKVNNGKMDANVSVPSLTVIPHVQPLLNGDIALDAVNMIKPVIDLHLVAKKTSTQKNKPGFPGLDISELKLSQPMVSFTQESDSGMLMLNWKGESNTSNFLQANDIHAKNNSLSLGNLQFYLTDFVFTSSKGKTFTTGDGKISARVKNIKFDQEENQPINWAANISNFDARDLRLDSMGKTKGSLLMNTGNLTNLNISSSTISDLQKLAAANSIFKLQQFTGHYSDANTNFRWFNAGFNRGSNIFSVDSFFMTPALSRDSFLAKQSYQVDYIQLQSGAIHIGPLDINAYIKDKTLNIGTATIDRFLFTDFKDKQLPFKAGTIKPLPVDLVKKIPLRLFIKTVQFNNAYVEYTETNEKTNEPGTIPVTRMAVTLNNVKNYDLTNTDSLQMLATGYLMDTLWTRLRVKESYTDSLSGFLMTLRMSHGDLKAFNSALIPLLSAKLESAYLDTLNMRAVGKEYLSHGEMKMFYHDLKIKFLKKTDKTKTNLLSNLKTFLANSFLIRDKNTSRTGQVFFIRKRDKSAINYLIKIAMSGMASSVGAKSNRKMMRKYKKELMERNLPPIDFD